MLGNPYRYRDARRARRPSRPALVPAGSCTGSGMQHLPFNTVFQLTADRTAAQLDAAVSLLIPDLLAFWLTGRAVAERTNASTTGLLESHRRMGRRADRTSSAAARAVRGRSSTPGTVLGGLVPPRRRGIGRTRRPRDDRRVARHRVRRRRRARDRPDFAYISCGTWSLVGVELERPVLTEAAGSRELHQRGRRRRPRALPQQRHGPVAAAGVRARLGARRRARST